MTTTTAANLATARANLATAKVKTRAAWNAYNRYAILPLGDVNALAQAVRDAAAEEAAANVAVGEAILANILHAAIAR